MELQIIAIIFKINLQTIADITVLIQCQKNKNTQTYEYILFYLPKRNAKKNIYIYFPFFYAYFFKIFNGSFPLRFVI